MKTTTHKAVGIVVTYATKCLKIFYDNYLFKGTY
jgi:hypothetical protein